MASKTKITDKQEEILKNFFEFLISDTEMNELKKLEQKNNLERDVCINAITVFVAHLCELPVSRVNSEVPRIGNKVLEERHRAVFEHFKPKKTAKKSKNQYSQENTQNQINRTETVNF